MPAAQASAQVEERGFYPPQQMGAGGGPYFGLMQLSVPELDDRLAAMGLEVLPDWLPTYGGGGTIHVGRFLIGGMGYSGTHSTSAAAAGIARQADITVGHAGLMLGYIKAISNMKLTLGSLLGMGSFEAQIRRAPQGSADWTGVWEYYDSGFTGTVDAADLSVSTRLSASYFWAEPFISLRYWVIPLVALDLTAHYSYGKIGAGKLKENDRSISGAPEMDLSGMGFRIGIFFGF
jgi:hypothetical protein